MSASPNPSTDWATAAAAVAAGFSALAAFLTWRTQLHQLHESIKPELLIAGWSRYEDKERNLDLVRFSTVKNVGRGAARNVVLNASVIAEDNRPLHTMTTLHLPAVAAGESAPVDCQILLNWKAATKTGNTTKVMAVFVRLRYWDAVDMRHDTTVQLLAHEDNKAPFVQNQIAQGLSFSHLQSEVRSVKSLRRRERWRSIPILGRLVAKDA